MILPKYWNLCWILCITFCAKPKPRFDQRWFDKSAENCDPSKDLHKCSNWDYLSSEDFKQLVLHSIDKLSPPLKDSESIFEMGMGVGSVLKVLSEHKKDLTLGGSDISAPAIQVAKKVFPKFEKSFYVQDMTKKHHQIADSSYDHVVSFGALAMYLTKGQMLEAIKEATRIVKPGGSLLFTSFIDEKGEHLGSIIERVDPDFLRKNLPKLGLEEIEIHGMLHQGDRYQVSCRKKA